MGCVLIIGGSCDIGFMMTKYFKNKGYNIVVGYHNDSYKYIDDIEYVKCDVTNTLEIENVIKTTKSKYGEIDILINLSCVCMDNSFLNKTKNAIQSCHILFCGVGFV